MNNIYPSLKKWFEENYLDGDEIQGGQMLASQTCLDALVQLQDDWLELLRTGELIRKEWLNKPSTNPLNKK